MTTPRVPLPDLRALAAFRYELRCFLAFSEQAARAAGIEPQQHQLLLAVAGLPEGRRPNIRTLAERLCVQHHTTVALVDRLEQRGLLERERSTEDKREVLLRLTAAGDELLQRLSLAHNGQDTPDASRARGTPAGAPCAGQPRPDADWQRCPRDGDGPRDHGDGQRCDGAGRRTQAMRTTLLTRAPADLQKQTWPRSL